MPRVLNPNLVKIHRNYTVEDVATLYGIHKNSVRAWVKAGLPVCDDRRPLLILGCDLREYLRSKRSTRKRRCGPGEMYCLRCREARRPAEDMVDYLPVTAATGRLVAICPECTGTMNRYIGVHGLDQFRPHFDVQMPKAQQHISKSSRSPANCDFE